jgi:hypothetical protein
LAAHSVAPSRPVAPGWSLVSLNPVLVIAKRLFPDIARRTFVVGEDPMQIHLDASVLLSRSLGIGGDSL